MGAYIKSLPTLDIQGTCREGVWEPPKNIYTEKNTKPQEVFIKFGCL